MHWDDQEGWDGEGGGRGFSFFFLSFFFFLKIKNYLKKNLRYADDTTLVVESEEELNNLLMKVKEEN